MTPGLLLQALEDREIQLYVQNAFLRYKAPVGAFTDELRQETRALRQELLADWMCLSCERIVRHFYGIPPRCRRCLEKVEATK